LGAASAIMTARPSACELTNTVSAGANNASGLDAAAVAGAASVRWERVCRCRIGTLGSTRHHRSAPQPHDAAGRTVTRYTGPVVANARRWVC
jgi:hypothetical protein